MEQLSDVELATHHIQISYQLDELRKKKKQYETALFTRLGSERSVNVVGHSGNSQTNLQPLNCSFKTHSRPTPHSLASFARCLLEYLQATNSCDNAANLQSIADQAALFVWQNRPSKKYTSFAHRKVKASANQLLTYGNFGTSTDTG